MFDDSYFEIGSTHMVCQDYALSGKIDKTSYAIVSDGCSSAQHSELGSSILCHAAQYYLGLYYDLFMEVKVSTIFGLMGNSIIKRADEVRKLYPVSQSALEATLLIALKTDQHIYVFCWGDGVIIYQYQDITHVIKIDYPQNNAPYYLTTNYAAYQKKFGDNVMVEYSNFYTQGSDIIGIKTAVVETKPWHEPYFICFPHTPDFKSVTICSDGVTQYQDQDKRMLSLPQIIPLLLDYPEGASFIKKNMNFLKRDLLKKGWAHMDDVAIAGILL